MMDTFTGWIEGFPTQIEKAKEVVKQTNKQTNYSMKSCQDLSVSVKYSSVYQPCLIHCDLMNCSTPDFLQTHVHWVGDAIQPSHPLSSPSPSAPNPSQHQSLFQWVSSSHEVAKVLELQLQHQSFQWVIRIDIPQDWLAWFPCCPRDSQESSPTPQFQSISSSVLSLLYSPTLTSIHDYWKNHSLD